MIPVKPEGVQATPEQWQAIWQRGDNLLVSASAGSGKTKVLVDRIMGYIEDGINIDSLLIVTFTEAAAKEMKERLRTNLEKAITKEIDITKKHMYIKQLSLLPNATISTIHSFCMKVIRRYFYLSQLDPVFSLLNEVEGTLLKEKVWRNIQDELLEEHSWMDGLMRYFSSDRNDDGFTTLVYQLYDFSRSKPNPKQWISSLADLYETKDEYGEIPIIKDQFAPYIVEELKYLVSAYDELIKLAEVTGFEKCKDVVEADGQKIQEVYAAFTSGNYTAAYTLAQGVSFDRFPTVPKKDETTDREAVQAIKRKRDSLKKHWEDQLLATAFFESPEIQMKHLRNIYPMMLHLSQVVLKFYEAFQLEKKTSNKIDFSDLEHDTLAILSTEKNGVLIAKKYYQELFTEVLIDEYQDVNRVQEAILTSVARENNLFMVGDVKQSIYAFRLADPSLFRDKYEAYADENGGKRIILAENFRSRDQVLSFTNLIFRQIMDHELGQIDYDDSAALKTGNLNYSEDTDKFSECYIIQNANLEEGEEESSGLETESLIDSSASAEVHFIAGKIKELLANQFEIMHKESTRENPKKRPIQYKDIVILAPTKANNGLIEEIFTQYQIPVLVQKNLQYFKRTEIAIMMSALKIIDNPTQDIPFVAVLRSGIVGLDEIALAHIRKNNKSCSFYEACVHFVEHFTLEEVNYYDSTQQQQLKERIKLFLDQLESWRDIANHQSISTLIWQIYMDTNYLTYVHGQSVGKQRVLNLHALYKYAKDFEDSSFKGLRNFVRFIQQMQHKKQDLEEPTQISDEEDAVRVMTIHASKGLEYPVVFLMNAGKKFNQQDIRQQAIRSDELGVGVKYLQLPERIQWTTIPYVMAYKAEKNKLLSEEMRKLYVAMTRAREKLIIVGSLKDFEKFKEEHSMIEDIDDETLPYSLRYHVDNYLTWILMATMRKQEKVSFHQEVIDFEQIKQNALNWIQETEKATMNEVEWLQKQVEGKPVKNLSNLLEDLKQTYPYLLASTTASYQSVSEIKRMNEEPDVKQLPQLEEQTQQTEKNVQQYVYLTSELAKPSFIESKQKVSAAERGSGLHLLMQKLDLTKEITPEFIQETIQQLVETQFLEKEVAAVIPVDQVYHFFQSEFGRWIQEHQALLNREQAFSHVVTAKRIFKYLPDNEDSMLIHGIIDGFVELDDEIILFDYKTDHVVPTQKGIQKVVDKYKQQLNLYAEALETSYQKKVTKRMLCLLSIGQSIDISNV